MDEIMSQSSGFSSESEGNSGMAGGSGPVSRPPVEDFFAYLDGDLRGERLRQFEDYLLRNREARKRLKQLARLEAKMQEGLILEAIFSDARARIQRNASDPIDETLVAAWVDGALTREERAELAQRLSDPAFAVNFYRQAQTVRRATEQLRGAGDADLGAKGTDGASGEWPPLPAPNPLAMTDLAVTGGGGAISPREGAVEGEGADWLGKLLIHASADSLWVLDVAPARADVPPVVALPSGRFEVRLPFARLDLRLELAPAFRGVELAVTAEGMDLPAQFVLTDESGRRLHRLDRAAAGASRMPSLRPGIYRLMAPPTPVNVLICVNGELGTLEIHQLRGGN